MPFNRAFGTASFAAVALGLLLVLPGALIHATEPRAAGGSIDLQTWRPSNGMVPLNGEWEFVANERLGAEELWPADRSVSIPVPRNWVLLTEEMGLGRYGRGTYRLLVHIDPRIGAIGMRLPQIGSAFELYWNGHEVLRSGTVGTSHLDERSMWTLTTIVLSDLRPTNELRIVVSNHTDLAAGIVDPIWIGDPREVFEARQRALLFGVFVIGVLLMIGVYHLFLFAYRPKDRAPVWFGIICVLLAARVLVTGEFPVREIFPGLGFESIMKLSYLTFSVTVMLFPRFISSLFPTRWARYVEGFALPTGGTYSALILFTPTRIFVQPLIWFQLCAVVAGIGVVALLISAVRRRLPGSVLFGVGFLVLFLATINDILNTLFIFRTIPLASPALVVFVLFQSLVITKQFATAFAHSEHMSVSLQQINGAMQRFVPNEFLSFLKKESIVDIELGDHSEERMTVLFLDIRSFTNMSEALTPTENFNFINSFLSRMGPIVRSHRGFVDKYLGDGIMALFPVSPLDAAAAAIELRRELRRYNEDRAKAGYRAIDFGVGIHTGDLMLGTIGESLRMDGTVISDTVNLASRLESLTKELQIGVAISKEALDAFGGETRFGTRYLGHVSVKGKERSVVVYELYEGESPSYVERMRTMVPRFDQAVHAFEAGNYEYAARLLTDLSTQFPEDTACAHYMQLLGAALLEG